MTNLSVNINKFATLRNARGGNNPDVIKTATDCQMFGAQGITVHPRPDERHIRYQDVRDLKPVVHTELNVEGNPIDSFMKLVTEVKPAQVTLVPDAPDALTSDTGWDTIKHRSFLQDIIAELHRHGIRSSLFVDPEEKFVEGAAELGTDRIEFYTGPYAHAYAEDPQKAAAAYVRCAQLAHRLGLGINAGHDLDLNNLRYLKQQIPYMLEVSIGHALICDALYYGLENTIQMYLRELREDL